MMIILCLAINFHLYEEESRLAADWLQLLLVLRSVLHGYLYVITHAPQKQHRHSKEIG
jgi:hypothetical protein